ncbi:zinc finger domain-containing protein [Apiospora aurea]|uniref:Zinc finger domain-containing protein n=1 Tax=Apiospora aurea TaxID=335848 RepID=A0ABR1Q4M1_9PEZI
MFPRFSALPPELRLHVWRFFAPIGPDRKPQVFAFETCRPEGRAGPRMALPCPSLAQQTASVRAVLAVSQESRAEALRAFPDTLGSYTGNFVIRFDGERDVVLLDKRPKHGRARQPWGIAIPELAKPVRQLAIGPRYFNKYRLHPRNPMLLFWIIRPFERVHAVYYTQDASVLEEASCSWCVSTQIHHFYNPETEPNRKPLRRPEIMYCWPNLVSHREYAQQEPSIRETDYAASHRLRDFLNMFLETMYEEVPTPEQLVLTVLNRSRFVFFTHEDLRRFERVEYWPMVAFVGFSCVRRYRSMGGVDVEKHPDDSDLE